MVSLPLYFRPYITLVAPVAGTNAAEIVQLSHCLRETKVELFVGLLTDHQDLPHPEKVVDADRVLGGNRLDRCSPADRKQADFHQTSFDRFQGVH